MTFDKQAARDHIAESRHIANWPTAIEAKLADLLEAAIGHIGLLEARIAELVDEAKDGGK